MNSTRIAIIMVFVVCAFAWRVAAEERQQQVEPQTQPQIPQPVNIPQKGQIAAPGKGNAPMPKKAEADRNFDGKPDRTEYYDKDGNVTRIETDTNYDGKIDEWVEYKNGVVSKAEKDANGDGKPDTWLEY